MAKAKKEAPKKKVAKKKAAKKGPKLGGNPNQWPQPLKPRPVNVFKERYLTGPE